MLTGILVRGASQKAMPIVVSSSVPMSPLRRMDFFFLVSAVGLNFVIILGLMMLAFGLGGLYAVAFPSPNPWIAPAHRLPYIKNLFGYHTERAKTKGQEMRNVAQQNIQAGLQVSPCC